MKKIQETAQGGNAYAEGDYSSAEGGAAGDSAGGVGGDGGHAHALGRYSVAVGGRGGRGGIGKGGRGGDAFASGEGEGSYGGNGGESSQHDGRGGRGGTMQMMEIFFGTEFARRAGMKLPYGAKNTFPGRGGDSLDTPQHMARRSIVENIKRSYFLVHGIPTEGSMTQEDNMFPLPPEWQQVFTGKFSDVWYDRTVVPLTWINEQVQRRGNLWHVIIEADEYVFIDDRLSCSSSL